MKSHKKNLNTLINQIIHDTTSQEDIPSHIAMQLSRNITDEIVAYNTSIYKDFVEKHQELILKYEQNRKFITDYIRLLQKESENLLKIYKDKGFVKVEFDSVKRKVVMKHRTEVLKETCLFMTALNDMVVKYQTEVMQRKPDEILQQKEYSLF